MRIAIDARMVQPGAMHGIARYVYQLLLCFKKQPVDHKFLIIVNERSPLQSIKWPDYMELVCTSERWIGFYEQIGIPRLLKKLKAELFHAPSFVAPLLCPCPLVMTIHDLNHIVLSRYYTPFHQFYYHMFVRNCIKRSRAILTVSHFSKQEIVDNFGIEANKISVTYNGVSNAYQPVENQLLKRYVQETYALPEDYIFCLSNNKPHKNLKRLVQGYCLSNIQIPLVIGSSVDIEFIEEAERAGKKHLLYFLSYIEEKDLPVLYSLARLFVYPSTYEGFGLPPLESLRCGTPVLVANSTSLPEVVGQHAQFLDPEDPVNIAKSLEMACTHKLTDEEKDRSILHAEGFTWDRMAHQTLEVYQSEG